MPISQSFLAIISVIIGLVGLGFGALMYLRPPKRTRFVFQTAPVLYFDQDRLTLPIQAAMTFDGQSVERLSKTTIVLWNAGTEALRGEDIVNADPVRFSISAGRLLNHRVVKTTADATDIRLADCTVDNELELRYDYLNPGDGAVVELIHNGTTATVTGKAKGLTVGPEDWGNFALNSQPIRTSFLQRFVPRLVLILGIIAASWVLAVRRDWSLMSDEPLVLIGLVTGILASFVLEAVGAWWRKRRRYPTALTPPSNQ